MDNQCFACGRENANGLHLEINQTDDGVFAPIKLNRDFQGYNNIIHGGIVSTILDEMAVWAAYKKGHKAVTAELNMRIKKPMIANTDYIARGKVVNVKYKLVLAQAEIKDLQDDIIACADVKLIKVD